MQRTIITILLAVLTFTCCMAREKKPAIKARLKGYPSGAIDEYHFHAGKAIVKGRFVNRTEHSFSTFNVTGTDLFSNQDFVRTINIEPDGSLHSKAAKPSA